MEDNIINSIMICKDQKYRECRSCSYRSKARTAKGCLNYMFEDILALLKEQEPLEPYTSEGDMMCGNGCEIVGYIRESDGKIERLSNYCPHCGRPVKWD